MHIIVIIRHGADPHMNTPNTDEKIRTGLVIVVTPPLQSILFIIVIVSQTPHLYDKHKKTPTGTNYSVRDLALIIFIY